MDGWLRQSTAITIRIGPFISSSDGNTQMTSLSIGQSDVQLSKGGGAFASKNDTSSCTHDTRGYYSCSLNATDTNTLGMLKLAVHVTGALAVWHTFMVLPANVYNSLVAGSDYLDVDTYQVTANAINATAIASGAITNAKFASGAIDATAIASDAITAAKIATGAITNTKFAAGAVDASAIADNAITAAKIATGAITNTKFASGAIDAASIASAALTSAKFATDAISATVFAQGAADKVWATTTRSITDKSGFSLASGSISSSTFAVNAIDSSAFAQSAADKVWSTTTRAITYKSGFSLANGSISSSTFASGAIDSTAFAQSAADRVWSTTTRALTDKSDFALSSASRAAIWTETGSLGLTFANLLQRAYQMINNRMLVNESTGEVTLRNIGNSADLATGSVTSASGTTTRAELSWV